MFVDLPAEMQARIASLARIEDLAADEEVSAFGAAVVLDGEGAVCAAIVDASISRAKPGKLVPARGTFAEAMALRIVAGAAGARVAVWDHPAIEDALRSCPWVLDELKARADRLQALAGATMGALGELDEAARRVILHRLAVRVAQPGETVVEAGAQAIGLLLVCVGSIDLGEGSVRPGDVLFPRAATGDEPAPSAARAGTSGALLLVGDATAARELAALFAG